MRNDHLRLAILTRYFNALGLPLLRRNGVMQIHPFQPLSVRNLNGPCETRFRKLS